MSDNLMLNAAAQSELIDLTRRLIQFPTPDPPGREREIAQFVHQTLTGWGIASELDEFQPGRANVVARVRGAGTAPGLVFSAHLDTLPTGAQAWDVPPFGGELRAGRIYGRGASDMKGGLAAMMIAAKQVAVGNVTLKGDLILAFTAGESSNCLGAKRIVATGGLHGAGAIVVSEPTSNGVLIAEKGAWWLRAIATGAAGHVSAGAAPGANAILKIIDAAQKLRAFRFEEAAHPLLGVPTLNIGLINGGSAVNQVPDRAELGIDIRYLPGMTPETMLPLLQAAAGAEIAFETIDLKAPVVLDAAHPLAQLALDACEWRLGARPTPGGVSYFSDAVIYSPALDLPRVILGPGELGMSGQRNEYCEVDRLIAAADIFVWLARRMLL